MRDDLGLPNILKITMLLCILTYGITINACEEFVQ